MKDIVKKVESDLSVHFYDNRLYFVGEDEKNSYNEIKKLLKKDYGFLDVNISFDDFIYLKHLIELIPKEADYNHARYTIVSQYLNYKLLKGAGIDYTRASLDEMEKAIYSADYEKFSNMELMYYVIVDNLIKNKAKETKRGHARINILLDGVDDIYLQNKINDLFVYRTGIAMMGYTNTTLCTFYTSTGRMIQDIEDYGGYYSDEKMRRFIRRSYEK